MNSFSKHNRSLHLALVAFFAAALCVFPCAGAHGGGTDPVTFVQISDVHLNPGSNRENRRMVGHSLELLKDAVSQVNGMSGIDFVIFTGDMADGPSAKLEKDFIGVANTLNVPWMWAVGNHDIGPGALNKKKLLETMNAGNSYVKPASTCYSFRAGGFMFFSMDGASDSEKTSAGFFPSTCLSYMGERLKANPETPAVIFQHFPLVYPFPSKDHGVRNQEQYLKLIQSRPNVEAVFSGHFHMSKMQMKDGVLHVSTPALVEYPNAFRVVTLERVSGGTSITVKTVETRLKSVQSKSAETAPVGLNAGTDKDRSGVFLVK